MINFRPVFLLALAAALAAFLACSFGWFALLFSAGIAAVCAVCLFVRRKKKKPMRGAAAFCAILVALFCAVAAGFQAVRADYENAPAFEGKCLVTGTVREVSAVERGWRLTLDGVSVFNAEGIAAAEHKMYLYVYGGEDFSAGTRVRFTAEIETLDFIVYGDVNASAVLDGVKYRASVPASGAERIGKEFDLFGAVRDGMRSAVFSGMEDEQARLAYAMLTGDDSLMDEGLLDGYRYGGVAHIFAVSGLNIGIIYGLMLIPLKKFRVRAAVRVPVIAAVLLFYTGVCGFSASPVRAAVMCAALSLSDANGMKYDALNSVSFAALAVMLVNPVYFYQVGFRLSVAATGGLIVLGGALSRLFARIPHVPEKLSSAVAVCLSAQLATFPVLLDAFGYVSALGLLLNLIFVPLASAVYAVLFVCAVFACMLPFGAGVLLWLPEILLVLLELPVRAFDWEFLLICGFSFGGFAALWFLLLFFLSDKVNLKAVPKAVGAVLLSAVLAAGMAFQNAAGGDINIRVCSRYGTNLVFIERGKENMLAVTGELDPDYAERYFLSEGNEFGAVFLLCAPQEADQALSVVLQNAGVARAYVSADAGMTDAFRTVEIVSESAPFSVAGMYAEFVGAEGLMLRAGGARILVAGEHTDASGFYRADVLIGEAYSAELYAACKPAMEAYFEKTAGKIDVYESGDLQICVKDGIISCKGRGVAHEVRIV